MTDTSTKVYAPMVRRRTPTFPSKGASYFDCTRWGAGYMRVGGGPGAAILDDKGHCLDLRTGEVYVDKRFVKETP